MAINLNLEKYGDQFRAFVEFAKTNANNADALACIEGDENGVLLNPDGNLRRIVAKAGDEIKGLANPFFKRSQTHKDINNAVRDLFKETVLKVCGVGTIDELPPSVLAVMKKGDYGANGGHPLSVRRIKAVTDAIRALDAGPIPITGNGADIVREALLKGSGLEKEKHPGFVLKERMVKTATFSVQTLAANGMAHFKGKDGEIDLDGYTDTFQMDIKRGYPVSFNGGPQIHTLGAAKARDAYVDFLTDGEVKTYAEADDRTKIKAIALMMLTMQGIGGCAIKAAGCAFDSNGTDLRLSPGGNGGGRIDYVNVTKDAAGNIIIESDTTFNAPTLIVPDSKKVPRLFECDGDSSMAYHLKVTVDAESLDRFGGADWKNFDREAIRKIENNVTLPHRFEEAAKALPDDTKLNVDVDISLGVSVDNIVM